MKVKDTCEAPLYLQWYKLNTNSQWQLESELWPIMWFWRHVWRHCACIFDLAQPWSRSRSNVKVKVTFEAPFNMLSHELNTKDLWQLGPELWSIMYFQRHLWRHCDVQWRRTGKKSISLESVNRDHSFEILLDRVEKNLIFSKTLTLHGLSQGQGQRSRSMSRSTLLWTCFHMNLTRRLYYN